MSNHLLPWLSSDGAVALGAWAGGLWGIAMALVQRTSARRQLMRGLGIAGLLLGAAGFALLAHLTALTRQSGMVFLGAAVMARALMLLSAGRHLPLQLVECAALSPPRQPLVRTTQWRLLVAAAAATYGLCLLLYAAMCAPVPPAFPGDVPPDNTALWMLLVVLAAFAAVPQLGRLTLRADVTRLLRAGGCQAPLPRYTVLTWRGSGLGPTTHGPELGGYYEPNLAMSAALHERDFSSDGSASNFWGTSSSDGGTWNGSLDFGMGGSDGGSDGGSRD